MVVYLFPVVAQWDFFFSTDTHLRTLLLFLAIEHKEWEGGVFALLLQLPTGIAHDEWRKYSHIQKGWRADFYFSMAHTQIQLTNFCVCIFLPSPLLGLHWWNFSFPFLYTFKSKQRWCLASWRRRLVSDY